MGGSIDTIEELKKLADTDEGCDCYLLLNYGAKSSKVIRWVDGMFHIIHEIDGSDEIISPENLKNTLIGKAIEVGALIKY